MKETEIIREAELLLKTGKVFNTYNNLFRAYMQFPDNLRIRQLLGLFLARLGATQRAQLFMSELYQDGHKDPETLGILGRIYKDMWKKTGNITYARLSCEKYLESFTRDRDYYTGINAATMSFVTGDQKQSRKIALEIVEILSDKKNDYWAAVTLGEAYLLLEEQDHAVECYRAGQALAKNNWGDINSSYQQMLLLSGYLPVPPELHELFRPPRIIAFTGHMIDRPGTEKSRFPESNVDRIKSEIKQKIMDMDACIGYCSASCGADILFIEAMKELNGEVNVLLPFSKENFITTSVNYAGAHWEKRFNEAIRELQITYITEEPFLGNTDLFAFTNKVLTGLSFLRANTLSTSPTLLAVFDSGEKGKKQGGTKDLIDSWPDRDNIVIIDISRPAAEKEKTPPAGDGDLPAINPDEEYTLPFGMKRVIKSILFADIVGFSKIQEEYTPYFMYELLSTLAQSMTSLKVKPEIINTWGDAIFAVYQNPADLVEFAFILRDTLTGTDWHEKKLPRNINIRIALHAGPVFLGRDPIIGINNAYGSHINRTSRMEVVTVPGCIYASHQFSALLRMETQEKYRYEYVGIIDLPKKFGRQEMYHITRRDEL